MKRIRKVELILASALVLSSCATPSDKIASELIRFGLDEKQANCVGNRLEARLSAPQLLQLARAAKSFSSNDPDPRRVTASDLVRVSAKIDDPRVPVEVTAAAASCGVFAGLFSS